MQELNYQLVKEDYLDWIHWNVARHNMKKTKIITALIYIVFVAVYVGSSIAAKKEPTVILSAIVTVLLLGVFMFYIISPRHQENMIWKKSGLKKLEKTNGFPKISLTVREDGVALVVPGQICKDYPYTEVIDFEETPRLFLLGTADRAWQFVAKSTFADTEEGEKFKIFINDKIADAKENPEKYKRVEASEDEESDGLTGENGQGGEEGTESGFAEAEAVITPVDTSSMGKIGKMANLMAAMAADDDGEDNTNEDSPS